MSGQELDRLQQIARTGDDLGASVAFYRDVLGLKLIAGFDPPGSPSSISTASG